MMLFHFLILLFSLSQHQKVQQFEFWRRNVKTSNMHCRNQAIHLGGLVRPSKEWGRFEAAPPSELLTLGATLGSISPVSRVRSLILPDERRLDAWPIDLVCDVIDALSAGGCVRAHFPEQRLLIEPSARPSYSLARFFLTLILPSGFQWDPRKESAFTIAHMVGQLVWKLYLRYLSSGITQLNGWRYLF